MATVSQLETQIRELRNQLEVSNRQLRSMREQIDRMSSVQYDALRRQYDSLLSQKVRENEKEYEKQLSRLRDEMAELDRRRVKEIHKALEEARKEQARLLKQLEDKNRELQAIIERMQKRQQHHEQVSSDYAVSMISRAQGAVSRASGYPHEFFFPNQFAIIREHLDKASELIEKQMYEAAAATADAARVEMELLLVKTQQQMDEWEELFSLYHESVRRLKQHLDRLLHIQLNTEAGTFTMNESEINFWSQGIFTELQAQITAAYRMIEEIEAVGITEYLKRQSPITIYRLNRTLNETEQMEFRMEAVDRCVCSERRMSDRRYVLAQMIIEVLERFGYIPEPGTGFFRMQGAEDPKERYDILYCLRGVDELCISLVPVRTNGVCSGVRCFVKWTVRSVPDPMVVRQLSGTIQSRIMSVVQNLPIQIILDMPEGKFEEMISRISQTPDPDILFEAIRH